MYVSIYIVFVTVARIDRFLVFCVLSFFFPPPFFSLGKRRTICALCRLLLQTTQRKVAQVRMH